MVLRIKEQMGAGFAVKEKKKLFPQGELLAKYNNL